MPKILSLRQSFFSSFAVVGSLFIGVALVGCGQKGALFLGEARTDQTDKPLFSPQTAASVVPVAVNLQTLIVSGDVATVTPGRLPDWQTALKSSLDNTNLQRYGVIDGDIFVAEKPLTLLIGVVQSHPAASASTATVKAGRYLQFRHLNSGVAHLPNLLAAAKRYLDANPSLQRDTTRSDFLTESEQKVDIYIAVN